MILHSDCMKLQKGKETRKQNRIGLFGMSISIDYKCEEKIPLYLYGFYLYFVLIRIIPLITCNLIGHMVPFGTSVCLSEF